MGTGTQLEVRLAQGRLSLCGPGGVEDSRRLAAEDEERLADFAARYRRAREQRGGSPSEMLALGREMFAWLDRGQTSAGWLAATFPDARPPLVLDVTVPLRPAGPEVALLNAPWELLADDKGHLAGQPDVLYLPVRRLGRQDPPQRLAAPSPFRLSVVFMAAAPRGAVELDFEREEAAIQKATGSLGLDLTVEESGTMRYLAECMARQSAEGAFDILHLSCHGSLEPPGLLLETDLGDPAFARADQLASALGGHLPRLLFLSACETASPERVLGSLAAGMILRGLPAVLGWGGSVQDIEAIRFAEGLYGRLARHESLLSAVTWTRYEMLRPDDPTVRPSPDWHTARIFLGGGDGGVLSLGERARGRRDAGFAQKVFLDRRNRRIPVAGPLEFVGRRRQIQTILRDFREHGHAGVLVHGMGRQGKSSLAARIAQRLERHTLLVLHGRYDEAAILEELSRAAADAELRKRIDRDREAVRETPETFEAVLRGLLEGPFREEVKGEEEGAARHPAFLVLDDFEQALEADPEGGLHRVRADLAPAIRAVVRAFRGADTASRLLLTSRFAFTLPTLPDGERDLACDLLDLSLPQMVASEGRKQARAKLRLAADPETLMDPEVPDRVVAAARGNPGLQDLLFSLALENPDACDRALAAMEDYLAGGDRLDDEAVQSFLADLALGEILDLLNPGERDLLRLSKLFTTPVPRETLEHCAQGRGLTAARPGGTRLIALGLWELQEDPALPGHSAVAINALAGPVAGDLTEAESAESAALAAPDLYRRWGGDQRPSWWGIAGVEVAGLALKGGDARVLAATAEAAVRTLEANFEHRTAAAWGRRACAALEKSAVEAPIRLLHAVGEQCWLVGDVQGARECFARALDAIEAAEGRRDVEDPEGSAAILISQARLLNEGGEPDEALGLLRKALPLLEEERFRRERNIALGEIAGILVGKGEVDEALRLHRERLAVFQELGDRQSRAITLGDIARILAGKGEVNDALRLHREALEVYQELGDRRSRAVTLGDIARILVGKGEVDQALQLHREALEVYQQLGDRRSHSVTLADIARILAGKGELDEALQLLRGMLVVFQDLGDRRSRALNLGDIARILADKGEVEEALRLHRERLVVLEELGDRRSRAIALGDIARILAGKGEVDEALRLHRERFAVFQELDDKRERAVTLGDIARILVGKGEVDEAIRLHQEVLETSRELGDLEGQAHALWSIAKIEVKKRDFQSASEHLGESYQLNMKIGRLAGICWVGVDLGWLLCVAGQEEAGLEILERSQEGFRRLGQEDLAQKVDELIQKIQEGRGGPRV